MNIKEKILNSTVNSIKFKLVLAVVIVQSFSSYIGQGINFAILQSRKVLESTGVNTSFFESYIGIKITFWIGYTKLDRFLKVM